MHNIVQALFETAKQFSQVTSTPRLDAEVLLAHLLQVQRSYLHAHPERLLSESEQKQFGELVKERLQGQPVAYLTGHCEFWSLDLIVSPDTLIPRPETELLVELVLQKSQNKSSLVADLGTGSGAIALALAHERPGWTIYATDSSLAALNIAKTNAARLQAKNIIFCQGSWCAALPVVQFDVIVSNPPYIAEDDPHLQQTALVAEPRSALVSAANGLKDIQSIIRAARKYLKPGGSLFLEHGFSQADSVQSKFLKMGYTQVTSYQDFSGLNRVTTGIFGIECFS